VDHDVWWYCDETATPPGYQFRCNYTVLGDEGTRPSQVDLVTLNGLTVEADESLADPWTYLNTLHDNITTYPASGYTTEDDTLGTWRVVLTGQTASGAELRRDGTDPRILATNDRESRLLNLEFQGLLEGEEMTPGAQMAVGAALELGTVTAARHPSQDRYVELLVPGHLNVWADASKTEFTGVEVCTRTASKATRVVWKVTPGSGPHFSASFYVEGLFSGSSPSLYAYYRTDSAEDPNGREYGDAVNVAFREVVIRRNGTVISGTPTPTSVWIGERVVLTAELQPSADPLTNKLWTVQGLKLKNHRIEDEGTDDSRTVIDHLGTSDLQGQDSISFHWYEAGARAVTFSVEALGKTWSGEAAFSVNEPTSCSLEASLAHQVVALPLPNNAGVLSFGSNRGDITVSCTGSGSGSFEIWNVIQESKGYKWDKLQPLWYEYDLQGAPRLDWRETGASHPDNPGIALPGPTTFAHHYRMDKHKTWLMFKPSSSEGRWVPLLALHWRWFGDARRYYAAPVWDTEWTLLAGNRGVQDPGSSIGSSPTYDLPEWSSTIGKITGSPSGGWIPVNSTSPPPVANPWDLIPSPW
jgi:hypothetical protein